MNWPLELVWHKKLVDTIRSRSCYQTSLHSNDLWSVILIFGLDSEIFNTDAISAVSTPVCYVTFVLKKVKTPKKYIYMKHLLIVW